jgi:hypothetical protein
VLLLLPITTILNISRKAKSMGKSFLEVPDTLLRVQQTSLVIRTEELLQLLSDEVELAASVVLSHFANYHLLDELVLLFQFVDLEIDLSLESLLLSLLAVKLAFQVLDGDFVVTFHALLLSNSANFVDFCL